MILSAWLKAPTRSLQKNRVEKAANGVALLDVVLNAVAAMVREALVQAGEISQREVDTRK